MRFWKAAAAALALTGALAQPAAALDNHSYFNSQTQDGRTISQWGYWQTQPRGDGTTEITFECLANGAPLASSLGFKHCYLEGENGDRYLGTDVTGATPGLAKATAQVVVNATDQRHRICIQTNAFYMTESEFMDTVLTCSTFQ